MKKLTLFAAFIALGTSSLTLEAQIDNRNNYSPEWVRSAIRNATADAADAAVFNPGGVTRLEQGFHLGLGNQMLFRSPEHSYTLVDVETTRKQDGADYVFPSVFMAYNTQKWALTGGMFISGGGATANYPEGSISTDMMGFGAVMGSMGAYTQATNQYLEASSYYMTYMLGGAYAINDKISLGANFRYIMGQNATKAGFTLTGSPMMLPDMPIAIDLEQEANAMSASFGVFYTPTERLAISARYDMMAELDFETKVNTDDSQSFEDGSKANRDLPAVLATGVSYKLTDKVRVEADFNYYFQENADWEKSTPITDEKPISELAGNAYATALGAEIDLSEKLLFSLGVMYTAIDFNDKDGYYTTMGAFETVPGNNTSINTGFRYRVNENIAVNLGMANVFWEKDQEVKAVMLQPNDVTVTTNNKMTAFGLGVDFNF